MERVYIDPSQRRNRNGYVTRCPWCSPSYHTLFLRLRDQSFHCTRCETRGAWCSAAGPVGSFTLTPGYASETYDDAARDLAEKIDQDILKRHT